MRRSATWIAALWVTLLPSGSAGALEVLTGQYEGRLTCKGFDGGRAARLVLDVGLGILEGISGAVDATSGQLGRLAGFVVLDLEHPDRGWLSLVQCGGDAESGRGAIYHLAVRTKVDPEKATLKGSGIVAFGEDNGAACKLVLTRTSTDAPDLLPPCP